MAEVGGWPVPLSPQHRVGKGCCSSWGASGYTGVGVRMGKGGEVVGRGHREGEWCVPGGLATSIGALRGDWERRDKGGWGWI